MAPRPLARRAVLLRGWLLPFAAAAGLRQRLLPLLLLLSARLIGGLRRSAGRSHGGTGRRRPRRPRRRAIVQNRRPLMAPRLGKAGRSGRHPAAGHLQQFRRGRGELFMPLPRAGLAKRGRAMPRNVTCCPRTGAKGGGGAGVLCAPSVASSWSDAEEQVVVGRRKWCFSPRLPEG